MKAKSGSRKTREVVINTCHGGFSLSWKALGKLLEWGHPMAVEEKAEIESLEIDPKFSGIPRQSEFFRRSVLRNIPRGDSMLLRVIRELGKEADGGFANLKIVKIPAGIKWEIGEYDGLEWVQEKHRRWS